MAILTKTVKTGKGIGRFLALLFKFRFLFFFVLFILINSVIIGIEAKSITPIVEDLGPRFLAPTLVFQERSQEIIANEGFPINELGPVRGGVEIFLIIVDLLFEFWVILIYISVLTWIFTKFLLGTQIPTFIRVLFGIGVFIVLQSLYISQTGQGTIMTPILAFKDFFKATGFIVKPLADFGEKIISRGGNETKEIIKGTLGNLSI